MSNEKMLKLSEGTDPMLLPLSALEEHSECDEFLRGVFFARLSYKAAGSSFENLAED